MLRANTASVMVGVATPSSSALMLVQRPVPFCFATSRITSTMALPVSASFFFKMLAVISTRYEDSSPLFHSSQTFAISSGSMPSTCRMIVYTSAMSCMSAYSMPLWTIFT